MGLKDKLLKKEAELKDRYQKGKIITGQMKAEKIRAGMKRGKNYGPGSIKYGLQQKQSPLDFMKDMYKLKKEKREIKNKEK